MSIAKPRFITCYNRAMCSPAIAMCSLYLFPLT